MYRNEPLGPSQDGLSRRDCVHPQKGDVSGGWHGQAAACLWRFLKYGQIRRRRTPRMGRTRFDSCPPGRSVVPAQLTQTLNSLTKAPVAPPLQPPRDHVAYVGYDLSGVGVGRALPAPGLWPFCVGSSHRLWVAAAVYFQPARAKMATDSSVILDSWDFVFVAESITKSPESPSSRSMAYAHISLLSFCGSFCVETRPGVPSFCHFGTGITGPRSLIP